MSQMRLYENIPEETSQRLYQGGSLASLTALLESVGRLVTSVTYGANLQESFARLNPDGSWEKTLSGCSQVSLDGFSDEYSETWPAWGIVRDGECGALAKSEQYTSGNEFLLLPTLTATQVNHKDMVLTNKMRRLSKSGNDFGLNLQDALRTYPTLVAADVYTGRMKSSQQSPGSRHSVTLAQTMRLLPTLVATDFKRCGENLNLYRHERQNTELPIVLKRESESGGELNPAWLDWFMGFPIGHTELDALETP